MLTWQVSTNAEHVLVLLRTERNWKLMSTANPLSGKWTEIRNVKVPQVSKLLACRYNPCDKSLALELRTADKASSWFLSRRDGSLLELGGKALRAIDVACIRDAWYSFNVGTSGQLQAWKLEFTDSGTKFNLSVPDVAVTKRYRLLTRNLHSFEKSKLKWPPLAEQASGPSVLNVFGIIGGTWSGSASSSGKQWIIRAVDSSGTHVLATSESNGRGLVVPNLARSVELRRLTSFLALVEQGGIRWLTPDLEQERWQSDAFFVDGCLEEF